MKHGNYGKHGKHGNHGSPENPEISGDPALDASPPADDSPNTHNTQNSQNSHNSHAALASPNQALLLSPRGDYRTLLSYQKAEVVYEITYRFAKRWLAKGDRTIDQMVQAARSGKQNIIEGSKAAPTSKETEIKLTNVARASLEELLEDYCDFLRVRDLPLWDKNSREARYVRAVSKASPLTFEVFREFVETRPAEIVANIAICLIHQANFLLDRQLRRLEQDFLKDGGLRERMTRMRLEARDR
jgi:four helix bundle suffix protein